MPTFKARVESIIGTVSSTANLDIWLSSGAKFVLVQIPAQKLYQYAQAISFTTSVALWNRKLVNISVGGYTAKEVPLGKQTQVADSGSIHYATALTPAYLVQGNNLYVYPTGTSSILLAINYPDVVNTDLNIVNFPPELEDAVVYYACITGLLQRSFDKLTTDMASISFAVPTAPTAISGAITMTATLPVYNPPVADYLTSYGITYTRTDEDFEKANAELQIQQLNLSKYNEDIQNANAQFQADITKYTTELTKEKAETDLEIQQYLARVQNYANQVQYESQRIGALIAKVKAFIEVNNALSSTLQSQMMALIQGYING